MKQIWISLVLTLGFVITLSGAYLTNMPTTITQPDGSKLECFASGDEYHNWLHDAQNFTIILNPQSGYYCYAELVNGQLVATDLVPGRDLPHSLKPGLNISEEQYKAARASKYPMPAERDAPTSGTINNLVIFIRFSGEAEFGQNISTYEGWFNSNASSLKNYFQEASYNQLTVDTHFYPVPSGSTVLSWQDSHPRGYYQPYSSSNTIGYSGDTQRRDREFTLLNSACVALDPVIPNSLTIDSDNDGRVDNVVFIISGGSDGWSDLLWPHRWAIYDRTVNLNGKRVYDFNLQLKDFLSSQNVGVLCHEFFHTLGAPDLYHYTSNGINPVGAWDLMQSNTNPPQHMSAYMKYKYGDWIDSIPTISADQSYTLNALTMSTGQAYRINSNDANQYYVLEYRKQSGTFESSLPGSGLLIYRIDTRYDGNADGPPDEVYLFRPGGNPSTNGSLNSANFSLESGRSVFNSSTDPYPFLQDGGLGNLSIYDVGSASGNSISFSKGSAPQVEWDFSQAPYLESFENSFPPHGWISQSGNGTRLFERVTSGGSPACNPHDGSAMLRYNSYYASDGHYALLVTPKMIIPNSTDLDYQISFAMYRDNGYLTRADRIELYLNSRPDLSGSPSLISTVNRSINLSPQVSNTGWYQYSFPLTMTAGANYYLIFKAISGYGNNMFLDNFRLRSSLKLPYTESFDDLVIPEMPSAFTTLINSSSTSAYLRSSTSSYHTAPNCMQMNNSVDANADLRYISAALPLAINRLKLSFWAKASSSGQTLLIGSQTSPDATFNLIQSVELSSSWSQVDLNLSGYSGSASHIVFKHGLGASYRIIYIDDLQILPLAANDMHMRALRGPAHSLDGLNMEFTVDVLNDSYNPSNTYSVQLRDADTSALLSNSVFTTPVAPGEVASHSMICNIPQSGFFRIQAMVLSTGDNNSANNASGIQSLRILHPDAEVPTITTDNAESTANTMPFNFYWKNNVAESIYLADEIFYPNGNIVGLMYHYNFVQDLGLQALKVWIKNTTAQDLSSGWLDAGDYTLVFDGMVDFELGEGTAILSFAEPFVYTGGNLAIRSNRPMDIQYYNSSNHFVQYNDPAAPNRGRFTHSDVDVLDPLSPIQDGSLSSNIPKLTLMLENIVLEPTEAVLQLDEGVTRLNWEPIRGAHSYQVWQSTNMQDWILLSEQTETNLDLPDAAKAFFRIVGNSDAPNNRSSNQLHNFIPRQLQY
ncbi:MAG: M6 family metalloprotease domain-containing protein [Candidatus Cloacimonetes bacterium]|nr:M6 family metalloprotease domain-containing protein [Candidatus Cloacimonadota bacterium]